MMILNFHKNEQKIFRTKKKENPKDVTKCVYKQTNINNNNETSIFIFLFTFSSIPGHS